MSSICCCQQEQGNGTSMCRYYVVCDIVIIGIVCGRHWNKSITSKHRNQGRRFDDLRIQHRGSTEEAQGPPQEESPPRPYGALGENSSVEECPFLRHLRVWAMCHLSSISLGTSSYSGTCSSVRMSVGYVVQNGTATGRCSPVMDDVPWSTK